MCRSQGGWDLGSGQRSGVMRLDARVPFDKSEGGVKVKSILSVFLAPFFCQRG